MEYTEKLDTTIDEVRESALLSLFVCTELIKVTSQLLHQNPYVGLSTTSFSYHIAKIELVRQINLLLVCCDANHSGNKARIALTQMEVVANCMTRFSNLASTLFDLSIESTKEN
jgi:hypothetical protein